MLGWFDHIMSSFAVPFIVLSRPSYFYVVGLVISQLWLDIDQLWALFFYISESTMPVKDPPKEEGLEQLLSRLSDLSPLPGSHEVERWLVASQVRRTYCEYSSSSPRARWRRQRLCTGHHTHGGDRKEWTGLSGGNHQQFSGTFILVGLLGLTGMDLLSGSFHLEGQIWRVSRRNI